MEDKEALETAAEFSLPADAPQHIIQDIPACGKEATCVVVGCVLLATDELLRVEELFIFTSPNLVNYCRLQVNVDSPGNILTFTRFAVESAEGVFRLVYTCLCILCKLTIRPKSML